jgi:hypothetical protein
MQIDQGKHGDMNIHKGGISPNGLHCVAAAAADKKS